MFLKAEDSIIFMCIVVNISGVPNDNPHWTTLLSQLTRREGKELYCSNHRRVTKIYNHPSNNLGSQFLTMGRVGVFHYLARKNNVVHGH